MRARDPAQYRHYAEGARRCLHIGAELSSSLFPNAALMIPEVGALGWTFGGRIIEMVLGSTTEYVLRNSSCPLFLNR
jgi:nucleotide-binding universal stress UspA family protein